MKLNSECVRAVLLVLEEKLEYYVNESGSVERRSMTLEQLCQALPKLGRKLSFTRYTISIKPVM